MGGLPGQRPGRTARPVLGNVTRCGDSPGKPCGRVRTAALTAEDRSRLGTAARLDGGMIVAWLLEGARAGILVIRVLAHRANLPQFGARKPHAPVLGKRNAPSPSADGCYSLTGIAQVPCDLRHHLFKVLLNVPYFRCSR